MKYWRMGVSVLGLLLLAAVGPSQCRAREITVIAPAHSNQGDISLHIERVWEVDGEIWVVSRVVKSHGGIYTQAIVTSVRASVEVDAAADAVVKHFTTGARGEGVTTIESREALETEMEEDGIEIDEVLYDSDAPDN